MYIAGRIVKEVTARLPSLCAVMHVSVFLSFFLLFYVACFRLLESLLKVGRRLYTHTITLNIYVCEI